MQIKKINNNKLKVVLDSTDLNNKNIDIDSFLSNSVESQDLFFEILDLAEEKFNFNIEDNKAVVETISLGNNVFILTITKLRNDHLDLTKVPCKIYAFEKIDDLLTIFSYIKAFIDDYCIYEFNNNYYLSLNKSNCYIESILSEYSFPINSNSFELVLSEHATKLK